MATRAWTTDVRGGARRLLAFGIALLTGCAAHPTRTARPEVPEAPWESRTVQSSHTQETYEYLFLPGPSPEAPVMVLLPGGFFDDRIWLNTHDLSDRFNVYALNWPDETPLYQGRFENQGDIAHDFVRALGIKELYLGGVSAGSFAAIDVVSRNKDLDVKGLFLFATAMMGITAKETRVRTRRARLALRIEPERARAILDRRVGSTDFHRAPGDLQMEDIFYVRPYSYYYQVFSAALNQGATRQQTMEVTAPTLVLAGSDDDIMDIRIARLTPTVFPDAELREFEGFKHDMVFTHGPELVAAMFEFLDRRGLASP